jgi:hypothetical protein
MAKSNYSLEKPRLTWWGKFWVSFIGANSLLCLGIALHHFASTGVGRGAYYVALSAYNAFLAHIIYRMSLR